MRLPFALPGLCFVTACIDAHEPTPMPEPIEPTATLELASTNPAETLIKVQWSADAPRRYVRVYDAAGNEFSARNLVEGTRADVRYRLPPGRALTAEAGYVDEQAGKVTLAKETFTTSADSVCDRATVNGGYTATISKPMAGEHVAPGVTPPSAFSASHQPTRIPDRYLAVIDETTKESLGSAPGYALVRGREYTFEVGWFCLSELPERTIPLASVRFSTLP